MGLYGQGMPCPNSIKNLTKESHTTTIRSILHGHPPYPRTKTQILTMIKDTRLYLIGFMASGKTTIGKKLAQKLGYTFLDLDALIVEKTGKTISEIFAESGEATFRKIESETLQATQTLANTLIATGGGTPCHNDNMAWIKENGTSLYLRLSIPRLVGRLRADKANRPMLAHLEDEALSQFIENLLSQRQDTYLQADLTVDNEGNNVGVLVNEIFSLLR